MSEVWRLFIAIELPEHVLEGLTALQEQLKQQAPPHTVRWVQPAGIHLTLKFLGDVPVAQREAVQAALQQAVEGQAPFKAVAGGLGCFPNFKRPRVAWVGVLRNRERLGVLRDAVEEHIAPLGYPTEDRSFNPHLTLGRVRRDAGREAVQQFGDLINRTAPEQLWQWPVTSVALIRSVLKPGGAEYTPLFHARLNDH